MRMMHWEVCLENENTMRVIRGTEGRGSSNINEEQKGGQIECRGGCDRARAHNYNGGENYLKLGSHGRR